MELEPNSANLINWILEKTKEEDIESVVIGPKGGYDWFEDDAGIPNYKDQPRGKKLTWQEAKNWLDYNFHDGYGGAGCNAIYVWTKDQVMWVTQYDGSTSLSSMPRNPIDIMPEMPGG